MTIIHKEYNFDEVFSFDELLSSSKDATFVEKPSELNYTTTTSQAIIAEQATPDTPIDSRKIGCSFLAEQLTIPGLLVHKLHNAVIYPGKIRAREGSWHSHGQLILSSKDSLFSESFGIMDGGLTLPKDLLTPNESDHNFNLTIPKPTKRLEGDFLFLGSMHDHFGHFLVEGLARLWILKHFSNIQTESLKILIYEPGLIPPATKMLEYLGINKSQVHFLSEPCVVDSVIAPSAAYRTHFWARELMNIVYDKIAYSALSEKNTSFPSKVFLSRNNVPSRKLINEAELETLYREAGYWVLRPEEIPIGDQIRIVANAESVAGCTGSNMYLTMFQKPGGINHIFAPYDFTLKDDAMISQIRKSQLYYVLGSPLKGDQWTIDMNYVAKFLKEHQSA